MNTFPKDLHAHKKAPTVRVYEIIDTRTTIQCDAPFAELLEKLPVVVVQRSDQSIRGLGRHSRQNMQRVSQGGCVGSGWLGVAGEQSAASKVKTVRKVRYCTYVL